jgi:choline dehydrogenase
MRVSSSSIIAPVFATTVSAASYLPFASRFGVPGRNASYDFVVIGGGTAGLAIATRLAENVLNSVAVIEAGGFYQIDNGNISTVPHLGQVYDNAAIITLHDCPSVDWEFETAPQAGLNNTRQHYWHGKTLGGSSA